MVNLEHKLTVDDLIVEYMVYKVKNGYEPQFFISEFMDFLNFFESKKQVEDTLKDGKNLFKRFFERKQEHDWYENFDIKTLKGIGSRPHMEMKYIKEKDDYIIRANYRLSDFDKSIINTYFMDNGMGKFDNHKGKTFEIRKITGEYLSSQPKRKIDESIDISDNDLKVGKYVVAEIIKNIWDSYIAKQVEYHKWPEQCRDINKYLFEMDLSEIIGIESIKKELIELYNALSRRIAIMYQQDRNLKISSSTSSYLARANYEMLIKGYEKIIDIAFGRYNKSLSIDLSELTFKESHEIGGYYNWDEDSDIKTTTTNVGNENIKKLVRSLDKNITTK